MAYFFGDGFDLMGQLTDFAVAGHWDSTAGNFALSLTGGRFGGRALAQFVTGFWLTKSSGQNDAVHHINFAHNQTSALSGSNIGFYVQLSDGATNQVCVCVRQDGAILLTSATPGGTVLATYTGAVGSISTWYSFECEVVIHPSAGSFKVRRNGNTSDDFSATGLNTRPGANSYANKLTLGSNNTAATIFVDDVLWRSDASSVAWAGDLRCYTRRPEADSSVQFARSAATFMMPPYYGTSTNQTLNSGTCRYTPFYSQGGTIGSVVVNLAVGYTGNMKCTVFAMLANGQPGAILQSATAPIVNPVLGANTFTFSPALSFAKGTGFVVGIASDAAAVAGLPSASTASGYQNAGFSSVTSYAAFPVANPSVSATNAAGIFPVVTSSVNADFVADHFSHDDAVSYVYSSTIGETDRYTLSPITATPSTIVGVVTRGYMQKSDAGSRQVAIQVTSAGTTVQTSAVLNTSWGWFSRTDLVDPATSAAWTASGVNNAQIGLSVTV